MTEFATNLGVSAGLLLLFTWVGYPILIHVLAQLFPRIGREARSCNSPAVSVILASRGPADVVARRIANLKETDYPADRYEIVIGIDASAEWSLEGIRSEGGPPVRVVRAQGEAGKPNALNAAVGVANGDVLVFADSAQGFEPDAIPELVQCLDDPRFGAVSGQLTLSAGQMRRLVGWYWRMERQLRASEARLHSSVGVTGAIYAMRRELFSPLPSGTLLDDLYTPMRVVMRGFRVGFTDRARATDAREFSVSDEKRRKERTLTGVLQLCSQMPAILNPLRNPIWLQFVFHKLMRLASPLLLLAMIPALLVAATRVHRLLRPGAAFSLWVTVAVALLALLVLPRGRSALREFFSMNLAVLRAISRGLRGDWDVW